MFVPINREGELDFEDGPACVANFHRHVAPSGNAGVSTNFIPRHVCQGSRSLYFGRLDISKLHSLLIDGKIVTVPQVEKVIWHGMQFPRALRLEEASRKFVSVSPGTPRK